MKLPSEEQIIEVINGEGELNVWQVKAYTWREERPGRLFNKNAIERVARDIIKLIKEIQFDDANTQEIDPNLIRIAELEAKLAVYEAVINGAGVKLAMPKKKKEDKP